VERPRDEAGMRLLEAQRAAHAVYLASLDPLPPAVLASRTRKADKKRRRKASSGGATPASSSESHSDGVTARNSG